MRSGVGVVRRCLAGLAATGLLVVAGPVPAYAESPPGPVTDLAARPGDGAVGLRWTVPPDAALVVVRRTEGAAPPADPGEGSEVVRARVAEVVDSGLANGVTYSYGVWTQAVDGAFGLPVTTSAVPAPPARTTLRLGLSAGSVTHGAVVAVTGVLRQTDGTPLLGAQVTLLTRPRGVGSFAGTAAGRTDGGGVVRLTHRVTRHTDFLLRVAGDAFTAAASSSVAAVGARHVVTSTLTPGVVEPGGTAGLAGRVTPRVPGGQVRLEVLGGSGWQPLGHTTVDGAGGFRFDRRPAAAGDEVLRVVALRTAGHDGAVGSPFRLAAIGRTLRPGSVGADVRALASKLTDLRYDVGPVGSTYGYDLRLAVMAFQKVHGLARTGSADAATRARLGGPATPRLRHPAPGLSVEVDLTRQVLYFAGDGVIRRILPVSSGNDALYTVDGVTSRATTPVGSFRVTRKIDGVRVSRLGELFQPAYFVGGFAIHGSPSVPAWPASHGCIRITRPAMARLFALLPVGTPVHVYRS